MKTIKQIYPEYEKFIMLKYKMTTVEGIKYKFKNYILPFFSDFEIDKITTEDYINFQTSLLNLNRSNSFYSQLHIVFKKFFDYIVIVYGLENIPAKVGTMKKSRPQFKAQVKDTWTIKEFNRFISKVDDPIYHALFNLLYFTGLRKGEAMTLKIKDFQGDSINVDKTITKEFFDGERVIMSPKSQSSIRRIRIDSHLSKEIKKLIVYYQKKYENYSEDLFLFGGTTPISCTTLGRKKDEYCRLANVKRIRIHDFRHSHATLLYRKKVEIKTIQQRLGHADIATTLDTYVHTGEKEEKKLIKTINLIRSR